MHITMFAKIEKKHQDRHNKNLYIVYSQLLQMIFFQEIHDQKEKL